MAREVWSHASNSVEVFDEYDSITECDCCGEDFDLEEEGGVDDCDAFCAECWREILGEDG